MTVAAIQELVFLNGNKIRVFIMFLFSMVKQIEILLGLHYLNALHTAARFLLRLLFTFRGSQGDSFRGCRDSSRTRAREPEGAALPLIL